MRWFWVDRFTEFVSGSHASGIKNVALDEEVVDGYVPGFPTFPPTLIIEGLAQLGGVLVLEHLGFQKRAVLAKIGKAIFHHPVGPGDQLRYHVKLDAVQRDGATVTCTSHCEGRLGAEIDLMFAFLEEGRLVEGPLYGPGDLRTMLQLMNFFRVAVDQDGKPIPDHPAL